MKIKTFILGGVATLALGAAGFAGPASAFTRHPGTPAEHRQTEDLNQQQLDKAMTQEQAAPAASGQMQASAQSPAAPSEQMTGSGSTASGAEAEASSAGQANTAAAQEPMAAPQAGVAQSAGATPVTSLANPPQALANASVETSNGQAVGAVQRVIVDASGKAKAVVVSLLGKMNKLVEIAANELTFDESRNVVVAQLDAEQIDALPATPQS
ncbi:MAG TPA: hypothetical protein VG819_03675 [Rhizomicrobium sp.]|jgi:hypothetical protein|nr:hypothetical protein [Rhizomicrobium sp.]